MSSDVENETKPANEIEELIDNLIKDGKRKQISWLQKLLLEACYVKLFCTKSSASNGGATMEAVPYHCALLKQSIPLLPWYVEQRNILLHQPFILLLHKLGFHLPADSGKVFPRIPDFWTADVLFSIAKKLGPLDISSLKFDANLLRNNEDSTPSLVKGIIGSSSMGSSIFAIPRSKQASSMIRFTPLPDSPSNWMQLVAQSNNCALPAPPALSEPTPPGLDETMASDLSKLACQDIDHMGSLSTMDIHPASKTIIEHGTVNDMCSVCDSLEDSMSSDLTKMCVSDEEEKVIVETSDVCLNLQSDSCVLRKDMDIT